jgi:hypothetical protein
VDGLEQKGESVAGSTIVSPKHFRRLEKCRQHCVGHAGVRCTGCAELGAGGARSHNTLGMRAWSAAGQHSWTRARESQLARLLSCRQPISPHSLDHRLRCTCQRGALGAPGWQAGAAAARSHKQLLAKQRRAAEAWQACKGGCGIRHQQKHEC